jgi:hypothetical protein
MCLGIVVRMARRSRDAATIAGGALTLCFLLATTTAYAQKAAIDDLKGKIFDAKMAQQLLGKGLRFCENLTGKGFYFHLRDRVLDLEEYLHSLENLAKAEVYNPEKRRPWSVQDVKERWEEVKRQAADDKQKCDLVRSLPEMEKRLQELEASNAGGDKNASAPGGAGVDKSAGSDK